MTVLNLRPEPRNNFVVRSKPLILRLNIILVLIKSVFTRFAVLGPHMHKVGKLTRMESSLIW